MMNRNMLKILPALAAALVLAGCGAAAEKSGGNSAAAASGVSAPSPAPTAAPAANAATANASNAVPAPSTVAAAGASPGPNNAPPATLPTPRIGSGGNDFSLFTQARAAVNADPELKAANLVLDVKEGVVTLTGTVASAAQKSKAEQLVRGAGPKAVRNQLRVAAGN